MRALVADDHTTLRHSLVRVLKRIAFLPTIRRGKVRDIRRQPMDGTYAVADRLDGATHRVREAITT